MQAADVEALAAIESMSFSDPWSVRDLADLLTRDYCMYYVAEADGVVVGNCGLTNCLGEGISTT